MTYRMTAGLVAAWMACAAPMAGAQTHSRFEVLDDHAIDRVPGLRIVTIHDAAFKSCYLVFLSEAAPPAHPHAGPPADVDQARAERDRRLADLLRAYEQDRSAIPGTIIPNPWKYDWLADSTQMEFALYALQQQFAQLEEDLDRIADATRVALTALPTPCAPPPARSTP